MEEFRKYVVPKQGVIIRDPKSKNIMPTDGFYVPWTGAQGKYWRRRVMCGDVILSNENKKEQ